jgi:hypothetical protein
MGNRDKRAQNVLQARRWRKDYVSPVANSISKPLETAGRKAKGAKVLRYYASPAAGHFASVWEVS